MRKAKIQILNNFAGTLEENDFGYTFRYSEEYLALPDAIPISLSLPLTSQPYTDKRLFPFFDGLIPEGWLLDIAECGLINLDDGQRSYITRRMDRQNGGKLHMEDMCQLTDRVTEQKYRGSMEQVGKAVLKYCTNPFFDALRLFELALFCFLTGNSDMHLKNFSLLYTPGGEVNLSPAYDLLPTTLLLPEDTEESALTINGKKKKLNLNDFVRFGSALHLTETQIQNTLARTFRNLPNTISLIEQGFCSIEMKAQYHSLITERAGQLQKTPHQHTY